LWRKHIAGRLPDLCYFEPSAVYLAAPLPHPGVHHALCNAIEPSSTPHHRQLLRHPWARHAQGTDHFVKLARKYRYILRADIEKYFQASTTKS